MSFTGDLEHLPIVDVIQLLHSTRKSGTLCIKSHKGECQLVFTEGRFVSANHRYNSARFGKVLVDFNLLSQSELERVLVERKNAGSERKPLIASLFEQDVISKEDAYKGLETLIEMTIVEVLTWTSGTFELDVSKTEISDEYRYLAEKLQQDVSLDAQSILMDSLRIYDEKMHDGTLDDLLSVQSTEGDIPGENNDSQCITVDLLGLDVIDSLDKKIPEVFRGLRDHNPADEHRLMIRKELHDLPNEDQELLCTFLSDHSRSASSEVPGSAVILFSHDKLISYSITTVCNHEGLFVFTTDDAASLDIIIEQSLARDLHPVLIIDIQHAEDEGNDVDLAQQKHAAYPQISILQMVCDHRDGGFTLRSLESGVRAVFPRPCQQEHNDTFTSGLIALLGALKSYLKRFFTASELQIEREFKTCFEQLTSIAEPQEAASILLRFAAIMFERSLTLVVGKNELIAEKGIGIMDTKSAGPSRPMMFKIPLEQPSVFRDVIENGNRYYAQCTDTVMTNYLFKEIGAPRSSKILLVPLKANGRVIALFYADFGAKAVSPLQTDFYYILAKHAGLVLDNALRNKKV